jgi:phospholipase/carboxylesterase
MNRPNLRRFIAGFIDELTLNSIDPKAVSLLGFSQGAILSYAIALSHPEKNQQSDCFKWLYK